MKVRLLVLIFAIFACLGAQAQKIKVGYDKQADFSQFKTYAWAEHGAVAHPLLAAHIQGAIEEQLNARGLKQVALHASPAVIIQMYGAIDQDSTFASSDPLYEDRGHSFVRC